MLEAFNNSTQFMTDEDLRSIARYLKTLPGDPARDGAPWQYDGATTQLLSSGTAPSVRGQQPIWRAAPPAMDGTGSAAVNGCRRSPA